MESVAMQTSAEEGQLMAVLDIPAFATTLERLAVRMYAWVEESGNISMSSTATQMTNAHQETA